VGKAYHLRCSQCGWQETFYLGFGKNDGAAQASEALEQLLGSEHGPFICSLERGTIRIERCLYRCRHCGRLQVRLQAQIHGGDTLLSPAYFCDCCGKLLGKVRPHLIKKQFCPLCQSPVVVDQITEWDIAPPAESALRVR